jgi:N utilization substance protein A
VSRDFIGALLQLNAEKNISREQLVRTVEEAIQAAYRRVLPGNENVHVEFDAETGRMRAFRAMYVVDEVEDPLTEFTLADARKHKPDAKVGDLVELEELEPSTFGRIHAQTAKQLFLQRLREVEREQVFGQYAERESEIITGSVSRVEPRGVILDVGRAEAVLATTDQSATEHYRIGQHVKAYVLEVRRTTKGPLIYVSRTHKNFLRRLFELEVPEIHSGAVEIKAIAREAGSRSKVAVASRQEGLDPVGATVGQRGGRVQAVVAELGGEKIDVIPWSDDPAVFVANALSPAQVVRVDIDEENRIATVMVPERMLSLAIGREGQNARLAAKLTGWRIDIRSDQAGPRPEPGAQGRPTVAAGARGTDAVPAGASARGAGPRARPMDRLGSPIPGSSAGSGAPRPAREAAAPLTAAGVTAGPDVGSGDERAVADVHPGVDSGPATPAVAIPVAPIQERGEGVVERVAGEGSATEAAETAEVGTAAAAPAVRKRRATAAATTLEADAPAGTATAIPIEPETGPAEPEVVASGPVKRGRSRTATQEVTS